MNNFRQKFTRKETYARRKIPIIVTLVTMAILVPTVGFVWFGWWDIAQNRKVLDALPLPPGAELYYMDSDPNYTAESLIIPHSWSTLAKYRAPGYTSEYLVDFYVSRMWSKWDYCVFPSPPGARFIARGFVVALDTSNAVDPPPGGGSFEILVEDSWRGNPCPHLLKTSP